MNISLNRGNSWLKSAIAGLIVPICLCLILPFAVVAVFLLGITGNLNVSSERKNNNLSNTNDNEKPNGTNQIVNMDGETF